MNSNILRITLVFVFTFTSVFSQVPTIGLQHYDINTSEGYTLFSPEQNNHVYLINNCGEKINQWTFSELPGLSSYLLENGNVLRAGREYIETRDWNNTIVWQFSMADIGLNQHHDIEPLPNGNVLCIITDNYSDAEMIAAGRNPNNVSTNFKLDKIIELEPDGINGANVVWEWKFKDHLIQDYDFTKLNFGTISEHPELVDINFDNGLDEDYTHLNGIDYNADLDQIIMSSRHLSELFIIDHSTTSAEAASHSGGNSGKGGDVLWRWGNPQVYAQGSASNQKLFLQHDSKWVESGYLDDGKITVYNNGGDGSGTFSSIHIITPEISNGDYVMTTGRFLPSDFEWSWDGTILGIVVNSGRKSATHSLPNGNFIICESGIGRVSEITKSGTLLWTYQNPSGRVLFNQMEAPSLTSMFRAEKYPTDYMGFQGHDLTSLGLIEDENSESANCISSLSINEYTINKLRITNPVEHNMIRFNSVVQAKSLRIVDINGRDVLTLNNFNGSILEVYLSPSIYFLQLDFGTYNVTKKLVVK